MTLGIAACNTLKQPYYSLEAENWPEAELPEGPGIDRTVFLFGETGSSDMSGNPLAPHIRKALLEADPNSTAIFLGSQLYPKGLSGKKKAQRQHQEDLLEHQLDLLSGFSGEYYFTAGEHDWEYRGDQGQKAVKRMADFIEEQAGKDGIFLPGGGCSGPHRVKYELDYRDIVLLFIDTQWWLENWDREPGINEDCDIKSRSDFIDELRDDLLKNKNKQLVVVMHHPLYSDGVHGGQIRGKYHFFPITEVRPKAWVPLPLVGSAAALHRRTIGAPQDIRHPMYDRLKQEILDILAVYRLEDILFVSSHDPSLQYIREAGQHFIVSGSAGGTGFARRGGDAGFASASSGFGKMIFYDNKEVWLEFYGLRDSKLELLFRQRLKEGRSDPEKVLAGFDFGTMPDSVTAVPGTSYDVGKFRRFWFGDTYRDAWNTPITAPTLDITREHGGLTPLRKGGGQQSNSLRLEDSEGRQYVFRSIYKSAFKTTPEFARSTWAQNVIQDMLSGSHPYGAFTVATMADAAGIYYTRPKLVYVPKQPGLGLYNESFGNELYLYEDRPAGNREDLAEFGRSEEIIGINDLLPKLRKDHDNQVDQQWVLRSRIFDLWLHDWDRHDDQWRWASFEDGRRTIYRPIPRDRDQVYFKFDGPFPWLASNFALRKFRTFKSKLKAPQFQSDNAKHFDRYFLNEMEGEDWRLTALQLQERLTDSVIHEAFTVWPESIYALDGAAIIEKLKSRREDLPRMAGTMYRFLAREVNVLGTNDEDRFEVKRMRDGSTEVKVYDLDKEGRKKDKYYERTFLAEETREIRLYGMEDDDEFRISGHGRKGIALRIIGGTGDDIVDDDSRVRGPKKLTRIYDERDGVLFGTGREIQDRTSDRYGINDYERQEFLFNSFMPIINFGSNIDDGFFFGGGVSATLHGWRKSPYKAKHGIGVLWAPKTNAFEFHYHLHRVGTFYRLNSDLIFEADLFNPSYINYYGQGNETEVDPDRPDDYYWVRLIDYRLALGLRKDWLNGRYSLRLAPHFRSSKVVVIDDRVSEAPQLGLTTADKRRKNFLGGHIEASVNAVEQHHARDQDGISLQVEAEYSNLPGSPDQYGGVGGAARYFLTFFRKLPTTLGTRIGGAASFGNVPFYHSLHAGGDNYIRGYRRNRYSGKYLFYQNVDLRMRLAEWPNPVLPMEIGILGGFDYGRVWEPGEDSDKLHKGYTAGIWISPFTIATLTFNMAFSEEERLFNFGFGFFF